MHDQDDDGGTTAWAGVDDRGIVQVRVRPGTRVTEEVAREMVGALLEAGAGRRLPVLVDMQGCTEVTRSARQVFARHRRSSAVALLGSSAVDRVVAAFGIAVTRQAVPTKFFTSRDDAERWLLGGRAGG